MVHADADFLQFIQLVRQRKFTVIGRRRFDRSSPPLFRRLPKEPFRRARQVTPKLLQATAPSSFEGQQVKIHNNGGYRSRRITHDVKSRIEYRIR
jgi:hypothetical protein